MWHDYANKMENNQDHCTTPVLILHIISSITEALHNPKSSSAIIFGQTSHNAGKQTATAISPHKEGTFIYSAVSLFSYIRPSKPIHFPRRIRRSDLLTDHLTWGWGQKYDLFRIVLKRQGDISLEGGCALP